MTREKGFRFRRSDLAPGRYAIAMSRYRHELLEIAELEVQATTVIQDFDVPPLRPGEYVALTVLDPAGSPLDEVSLRAGVGTGGSAYSGSGSAIQRDAGFFWVPYPRVPAATSPGSDPEYFVLATSPAYGKKEVRFAGDVGEITIQFEESATLDVTIEDYVGNGLEGIIDVRLYKRDGLATASRSDPIELDFKMSATGTKPYSPLAPGEYELELLIKGSYGTWQTAERRDLSLTSGENAVRIVVPPLHTLTVFGGQERAGQQPFLRELGERRGVVVPVRLDSVGRATVEFLPAGTYRLQGAGGAMTIELSSDVETDFEPESAPPTAREPQER